MNPRAQPINESVWFYVCTTIVIRFQYVCWGAWFREAVTVRHRRHAITSIPIAKKSRLFRFATKWLTLVIRLLRNALRVLYVWYETPYVCYLSAVYVSFLRFVMECLTFAMRLQPYVCYTSLGLLFSRPLAPSNGTRYDGGSRVWSTLCTSSLRALVWVWGVSEHSLFHTLFCQHWFAPYFVCRLPDRQFQYCQRTGNIIRIVLAIRKHPLDRSSHFPMGLQWPGAPMGLQWAAMEKMFYAILCYFSGLFIWKMCWNNRFKSSGELFWSILV